MKQKIGYFILCYLRFFAKLQLKKNKNCKIIGITGSAGKSSTRNAIYSVLKNKYLVKASFKANSESGISLDILGLEMNDYSILDWLRVLILAPLRLLTYFKKFDYYIVEMGIDSPNPPKNMDFLLSIVQPKMAVFLNANLNHSFAFDQLVTDTDPVIRKNKIIKAIAQEKAKLILSLPKTGFDFLNFDDANVKETCQETKGLIYSFGSNNLCDLQITKHQTQLLNQTVKTIFTFQIQNHYGKLPNQNQSLNIEINNFLLPKHYAYGFAVAILIGLKAGLDISEIKSSLENYPNLPLGRASVIKGKNQALIVDSSYNASSMKDMIELMANISNSTGRKIALLGDMRELGQATQNMHEEIAHLASQVFEQVFLVGKEMQRYALPILEKELPGHVAYFENSKKAGEEITKLLNPGDLILVKGSQNTIFLEEAVKEMMLEEKLANNLLCRQSSWWLSVKQQATTK